MGSRLRKDRPAADSPDRLASIGGSKSLAGLHQRVIAAAGAQLFAKSANKSRVNRPPASDSWAGIGLQTRRIGCHRRDIG